jgi:hypothetical protein
MKSLLLILAFSGIALAVTPDCQPAPVMISNDPSINANGMQIFPVLQALPPINNNLGANSCQAWTIFYSFSGFSYFSIQVETGPQAPGPYIPFPGTINYGANPYTFNKNGWVNLTGTYNYLRFNSPFVLGTGSVLIQAFGWINPSNVGSIVNYPTGGGAGVTSFATGSWVSWETPTVASATTTPTLSVAAATGQPSHEVIGTCGTATAFGPCALVAGDMPSLTTGWTGVLPKANGGTGLTAPTLTAGTGITISGTWPDQTVSATGSGGNVSTSGTNTYVSGSVNDFSASSLFKLPVGTTGPTANGAIAFDTAYNAYAVGVQTYQYQLLVTGLGNSFTSGDCVQGSTGPGGYSELISTGSPCAVGTVTSFAAPSGSWPTFLVPTVTNATTTPSLAVSATTQGNGTKLQLSTGSTTTNDCVKFDANGNTVDAGAACGSGGGSPGGTSGQIQYNNSGSFGGVTLVPIANGGTGSASPALVAGTNVTITGSWPNQTINSSAGGSYTWSAPLLDTSGTISLLLGSSGALYVNGSNALDLSTSVVCLFGNACTWAALQTFTQQPNSTTNCASSASPAVCGSAWAGRVVVAAASGSVVVDTTAVTANSEIQITFDSSLGAALSVTCNTTYDAPYVSARTAGTSFTISAVSNPSTNPACYSYTINN